MIAHAQRNTPELSVVAVVKLDATTATTESEKADLLNSYFHACFNKSHTPIVPPIGLDFSPPDIFFVPRKKSLTSWHP